jgi:hypothetical protein
VLFRSFRLLRERSADYKHPETGHDARACAQARSVVPG